MTSITRESEITVSTFVVVGGQFGSEAKGHVTAQILKQLEHPTVNVRVAGPNAGHTVIDNEGNSFALRQIPVGAAVNHEVKLVIGPGSEIDLEVLRSEVKMLEDAGHPIKDRLFIDPQATILEQRHHAHETSADLHQRLGSTGKGIGAARSERIMRSASIAGWTHNLPGKLLSVADAYYNEFSGFDFVIEGTQGYGLGLHAGNYPYCTSSDCRAVDFLAMSGLPSREPYRAYVVFRPYPIRVAGNSGPLANETTWDKLGLEPEFTTVTKKMRRVGAWDGDLARKAMRANGPDAYAVLTMADQVSPDVAGMDDYAKVVEDPKIKEFINTKFGPAVGAAPVLITTGPSTAAWL